MGNGLDPILLDPDSPTLWLRPEQGQRLRGQVLPIRLDSPIFFEANCKLLYNYLESCSLIQNDRSCVSKMTGDGRLAANRCCHRAIGPEGEGVPLTVLLCVHQGLTSLGSGVA